MKSSDLRPSKFRMHNKTGFDVKIKNSQFGIVRVWYMEDLQMLIKNILYIGYSVSYSTTFLYRRGVAKFFNLLLNYSINQF